jgi:hypothetical protein
VISPTTTTAHSLQTPGTTATTKPSTSPTFPNALPYQVSTTGSSPVISPTSTTILPLQTFPATTNPSAASPTNSITLPYRDSPTTKPTHDSHGSPVHDSQTTTPSSSDSSTMPWPSTTTNDSSYNTTKSFHISNWPHMLWIPIGLAAILVPGVCALVIYLLHKRRTARSYNVRFHNIPTEPQVQFKSDCRIKVLNSLPQIYPKSPDIVPSK